LKALQVQMKRAALSAESTNSTPPFTFGWLATIPTGRPSRRAKPTISSFAQRAWISMKEPASSSASSSSFMSNGLFSSAGISSPIGVSEAGASAEAAIALAPSVLGGEEGEVLFAADPAGSNEGGACSAVTGEGGSCPPRACEGGACSPDPSVGGSCSKLPGR